MHAIADATGSTRWRPRCARTVEPGRHVHLVLENDGNDAEHLRDGFDAQWNDDAHHVLHVLLTGETRRLLQRLCRARRPSSWRAAWPRVSSIRASRRAYRKGEPRGTPSADLPPTAFVLFLQNHDQIGNRPLRRPAGDARRSRGAGGGDRAAAARARRFRCSSWARRGRAARPSSSSPIITASSRSRARGTAPRVRGLRGLRGGETPTFPIPMRAETFERSRPAADGERRSRRASIDELLALRHDAIVPRLAGARGHRRPRRSAPAARRWRAGAWATARCSPSPAISGTRPVPIEPPAGTPALRDRPARAGSHGAARRAAATVVFLEPPA